AAVVAAAAAAGWWLGGAWHVEGLAAAAVQCAAVALGAVLVLAAVTLLVDRSVVARLRRPGTGLAVPESAEEGTVGGR
ncbi:hypothetical protein ABT295_00005, partial [Terrabacter sp. NPDC000476]